MVDRAPDPDDPVEAAVADFAEQLFGGKRPDPDAFCAAHPAFAPVLRDRLERLIEIASRFERLPRDVAAGSDEQQAIAGLRLGDYQLIRELGRGGMGVVYLAEQQSLRRQVALKVLPAHVTLREDAVLRFRREAATAARLRHKGIVEIHAIGEQAGTHFFAMELIEGDSLDRLLVRMRQEAAGAVIGRRSTSGKGHVKTACLLVAEVADALDHAHRAGVIHRDVKPSNIIVRPDGTSVLTDFGLAREAGLPSLTATGEFGGTPYYVSPEQAVAERDRVDHRTDIYSLGVTLYELLTLRRPFEGKSSQEVLAKIVTRDPPDPRKWNPLIPRDLVTILLKSLEKDPARRYASAADLAADLRAFLAYEPIRARPASTATRFVKFARRHRAAGATALLLVLAPSIGWLWWRLQPGYLLVESDQAPLVYIDGELRGSAPIRLALAAGVHRVRLAKQDASLVSAEEQVVIARGDTHSLHRVLASPNGVLQLESNPAGARVTLLQDGGSDIAVPQVTPTMFAVKSGRYRARFELESFPAQERSIEVAPGGALTPVMVPWDTGEVRLESVQEGVRIELFAGAEMTHGGSPLVEFTLPRHEPVRLPPGVYSLIAQLKGHARRYYERAEAVHVSAGHTVFKTVWLRPFRALFQVSGERLLSVSAAADLDGDGLLEILAPAEGGLDVLGSDGSRRFAVPTSGKITKALAADLDGDGSQEVIVAENRDGSRARISCVGSDGAPRCQTTFDEPILDVAAIDFHGDGEPLVVVSLAHDSQHPARVDCLSADGSSLWQRPLDSDAMQLVAVDQDGDGRTEVIAVGGGEAGVLLGLDASGSECLKAHVGGRVKSCQAVDLDGDGAQELVVRIENGGFVVFDGTGAERFARRRGNLVQLILRDLDGDGRTEVIGAERSDSVPPVSYVFAMTADAMTRFRTEIHDYCHELYIGDFGEPTSTEIAFQGTYISPVIDSHGAIVYSRSDGEDKFSRRPPDFSLPTLVSDVDGDGRSEVIGTPGSQIVIQDYQGRVISEIAMPQVLRQLATYDLDGNGVSEIVALSVDGTLTAYGLDPDQEWAVEMLPPEPEIVALMTYCARGSTAVVALSAGGRIAAFGSNGTKLWEHDEPHLTDTGDHSLHMRTLTVADCDQDGQPDIVAGMKDVIVGLHADGEKTFEVPVAGRVLDLVTLDLDRSRRRPVLVAAIDQNVWALVVAINADTSPRFEVKLSCVELATLPLDQDGPCRLLAVTFDARIVAIDEHGFAKALIDPKVDEIKGLSVADLDGDRRADLIFGVVGRDQRPLLTAWHQDGSQLFATPVDAKIIVTSVVDLDHDERPEIIAGTESGLVILRTDGSILFSRTTHAQVIDLAAVDLDDDGVAEVVAADWQGRISAFTLAGKLVWSTPMRSRVKRLLAADLDGDRHQELIAGDGSGIIATYAPRLKKRVR